MDVMLKNFLKALPSENQFIFKKKGAEALITEFFTPQAQVSIKAEQVKTQEDDAKDTRRALLYKTLKQSYRPDEKEQTALTNINEYLHETSHSASPPVQNVDSIPKEIQPALQIVTPSVTIATKEVNEITTDTTPTSVAPLPSLIRTDPQVVISVAQRIKDLDTQASQKLVVSETVAPPTPTETLVAKPLPQVQAIEPQTPRVTVAPVEPIPVAPAPLQVKPAPIPDTTPRESANVTSVAPEASLKAGFPQLPDTPNIVLGIIKDPRGRVIPNILVEIMNQQGVPVRAFKTNALGQFAAATPLSNGEYIVMLEDPRKLNEFEQIHITLDGEIFNPLEITSTDQREKLRRELFGAGVPGVQSV
jgi:hypothetical protein